MARTNYVTNPRATGSVVGGVIAGFATYNPGVGETGTTTIVTGATDGPELPDGSQPATYARRTVTAPKTSGSTGWRASGTSTRPALAGIAGDSATESIYIRFSAATDPGTIHRTVRLRAETWSGAGAVIDFADTATIVLPMNEWVRISSTVVATATFPTVGWWVYQTSGSNLPAGSTLDVVCPLAEAGALLLPYFDGGMADTRDWTRDWTGTANASTSTEVATPGVYVFRMPDTGAPQAGITITGLDPGSPSIVTIETSWDGGHTWWPVRSGRSIEVQGQAFLRDFVPALNVEACYRVVVESGPGFLVPLRTEDCITITESLIWIQDPLDPRGAVSLSAECTTDGTIFLAQDSLTSAVLAQSFDIVAPMDSSLGVASIGRRMLASRVPLNFAWRTAAESGALRRLLMRSGQLVIRGLPNTVLEAVAHIVMGPTAESRSPRKSHEVSVFEHVVSQVRPLAIKVVVPWWTYDQVQALWAATVDDTYDEVVASRPASTYVDWQEAPEPT